MAASMTAIVTTAARSRILPRAKTLSFDGEPIQIYGNMDPSKIEWYPHRPIRPPSPHPPILRRPVFLVRLPGHASADQGRTECASGRDDESRVGRSRCRNDYRIWEEFGEDDEAVL